MDLSPMPIFIKLTKKTIEIHNYVEFRFPLTCDFIRYRLIRVGEEEDTDHIIIAVRSFNQLNDGIRLNFRSAKEYGKRYRLRVQITDGNGIILNSNQPVMLDHQGFTNGLLPAPQRTFHVKLEEPPNDDGTVDTTDNDC